jgi:hypothetical protein
VRHEPLPRFVLGDAVDEQRGVPVTQAVEEYGDVDGHGGDKDIRKSQGQRAKSVDEEPIVSLLSP